MPRDLRTSYYFGLGSIACRANMVVVAIVFAVADSSAACGRGWPFPADADVFPDLALGFRAGTGGHIAMVLGLVLGPLLHLVAPGFDLLGAGLIGGGLAYAVHLAERPPGMTLTSHRRLVVALCCSSCSPAGLTTYPWRALGVYLGGRIREDAEILVLVRAIATALVAAVIGNLICFPAGPAAETTLALRICAAAAGFAAYFFIGRKVLLGIVVAEALFGAGFYLGY